MLKKLLATFAIACSLALGTTLGTAMTPAFAQDSLIAITNPANPLNPLNPANPASPLNPANQVDEGTSEDTGDTEGEEVSSSDTTSSSQSEEPLADKVAFYLVIAVFMFLVCSVIVITSKA